MNITSILHGLWRMDISWPCYFSAGKPSCCRVWYYQTPWGAWNGARRLHVSRRPRHRIVTPVVSPAEIEAFRQSWATFGGRDSTPPLEEQQ